MANAINAQSSIFFQSKLEQNPYLVYYCGWRVNGASLKFIDLLLFFLYIYTLVTGFLPNYGRYAP